MGLEQHVTFTGMVKNEELFRWYSAADVNCLASSREGFPCVLLESLACGTPVVATNIEGTRELVTSEDLGLLVEQDALAIADGLSNALQRRWSQFALAEYVRWSYLAQNGQAINEVLLSSVHIPAISNSMTLNTNTQ